MRDNLTLTPNIPSAITGGKFANGAVTGAFSRVFNDEAHSGYKDTRGFFSRLRDGVTSAFGVQVSVGVQAKFNAVVGPAKFSAAVNVLSVEKELTDDSPSQATQELSISGQLPSTRSLTYGVSQSRVMSAMPDPVDYKSGFDNLSVTDGGEVIISIGAAAIIGINFDFNVTQFNNRFRINE